MLGVISHNVECDRITGGTYEKRRSNPGRFLCGLGAAYSRSYCAPPNILTTFSLSARSPEQQPDADIMASFLAHELEESVTDSVLNAWFDTNGNENADLCEWTFGDYVTLPNGSFFNMKLGDRPYLIQQDWVSAKGGYCALKWDE